MATPSRSMWLLCRRLGLDEIVAEKLLEKIWDRIRKTSTGLLEQRRSGYVLKTEKLIFKQGWSVLYFNALHVDARVKMM